MQAGKLSYVIITPARNEETHIEKTIHSVVSQTLLPLKWVIVSDGSTDKTEQIVGSYLDRYAWIELVTLPQHRDRQFAAKVSAFNTGYQKIKEMKFDIIGNLDADISFEPDYFEFLVQKFATITDLGVAGTPFIENGYSSMDDSFEGGKHVAGGCQFFREECFKQIGGYQPVKGGGIDWIAVSTARMHGWKTVSFPEKHFFHHRSLGTAQKSTLRSNFDYGFKDYFLGGHPLWEAFRVLFRLTRKPYMLGGFLLMCGYVWGYLSRTERPVSKSLMLFHRKEQLAKLKEIVIQSARLKQIRKYGTNLESE